MDVIARRIKKQIKINGDRLEILQVCIINYVTSRIIVPNDDTVC